MTHEEMSKGMRAILAWMPSVLPAALVALPLFAAAANPDGTFGPGVWKTFDYSGAEMVNAPIVFAGWAKADVKVAKDFCIWLDITYRNGEHTYGRCAYFDKSNRDWQQARGVFKPGYPVKSIVVNALFRGSEFDRKAKAEGTCMFRDFTLERRAGTNEDFVVTSYSNRPFENTIEEITDHFNGEKVTRSKRTVPHADGMTSPIPDGRFAVWAADSMRRITPLTFPRSVYRERSDLARAKSISLRMARNERESAQVLVSMSADTEWEACELELPRLVRADGTEFKGEFKWERQGYLGREPGFVPHPFPIPDHEKWFPEILLPAAPMRVRAASTQGAWLTVHAAPDAAAGVYADDVIVKEKGVAKGRVPMRVEVADFSLPKTFMMPNAFALMDCYTERMYGKKDWKKFRREAQDLMLDHRLNPDDISRTELPEIEDLLHARERGMNCFNLLNVVPKPTRTTDCVLICKPEEIFNEKFNEYFFGRVKPFVEELKRHGLDRYAYVYGFDERGPEFYEGIRKFWERMQREIPGIPLMNTAKNYSNYAKGKRKGDESLLMGDWYCPVTWDHDFAVSEEIRRKTGKKVWWYTCCSGGFSNYEANPVERRIFGFQTWQVKADGFLYWMMNYWTGNRLFPENDTYFPWFRTGHWAGNAGDGWLMFPGEQHVLPTIRMAQIRDAMEDYEFAALHDRRYGREATMKIIEEFCKMPGTGRLPGKPYSYESDPDRLLEGREKLLEALSAFAGIDACRPRDGIGHAMAKIRAGKEVGVAYFGGSITQMDGWRRLTGEWLAKRYPQTRFREINAAIGGTGSNLGVFRVGKDVIAKKPDLVFVEFATNDSAKDPEGTLRNFDGIVRQLWANDPETDIVFVYTVTAKSVKHYLEGRRQPTAEAMEKLADHYGIPSVDWGCEVARRHRGGKMVMSMGEAYTALAPDIRNKDAEAIAMMKREGKTLFSKDGVHPALPGHELYVSELAALWQAMEKQPPVDHRIKGAKACFSPRMERAKIVPIERTMLDDGWEPLRNLVLGNWDEVSDGKNDQEPYFSSRAGRLWKAGRAGATLSFRFQGNYCAIYDLLGPGCGIAEITVDGRRLKDVARFDGYCSYYRLGSFVVFDGEEGLHEVKIVRSAKSPAKNWVKNRLPGTTREKYRTDDLLFGSLMLVGELK